MALIKTCPDCGKRYQSFSGVRQRCCDCANLRGEIQGACRALVNKALRAGRLIREACEVCGAAKVDAHHDDYGRPLVVRWLCRKHHRQLHERLKREARQQLAAQ